MLEELKNIKSRKNDFRNFGITVGMILIMISGFLFWKEKESFQIFLTIGFILCGLGIVFPILLKPVYWIWMIFATILGWFMTRLILSMLFYGVISPIGIILRLFKKQFIELKWDRKNVTYWNRISGEVFEKEKYEKQY